MEEKRKRTSSFSKIRKGFYKQMDEIEKKQKRKIIALLLASSMLFASTLIETSGKGKYTYIYGEYEQAINTDSCFYEGVQLVDLNALANYIGLTKEEANYVVTFSINNTEVIFENDNNIAIVNGIKKEMPTKAQIKNGYCLIPLSTVLDILHGIKIDVSEKSATVLQIDEDMYIVEKNPNIKYETDISQYLEYINSKDEYIYTLLNKQNPADRDFPEDKDSLIEIPAEYRKPDAIYLYKITLNALIPMMNGMFAQNIDDVFVTSAYRRYDKQQQLFDSYVAELMNKYGWDEDRAYAEVLKDTALPGQSEHQTGLCVDFMTHSMNKLDNSFEETEAFEWLKENSWKYGFVLRYPEDKEHITGYIYESWHYRFVGLEVASIMYQTGLCYEEYLEIFGNPGE